MHRIRRKRSSESNLAAMSSGMSNKLLKTRFLTMREAARRRSDKDQFNNSFSSLASSLDDEQHSFSASFEDERSMTPLPSGVHASTPCSCQICAMDINIVNATDKPQQPRTFCQRHLIHIGRFEDYKLLECLGEGAHGICWHARHSSTDEEVCIKELRRNSSGFALREAHLLAQCHHPNIVRGLELALSEDKRSFVVMNYCGTDVLTLMRQQQVRWTSSAVSSLFRQLLLAVQYLHKERIVHGDVTTGNMLVDGVSDTPRMQLGDFGLAQRWHEDGEAAVLAHPPGTMRYRAPELLLGSRYRTPASDMWAVGCVLAELALGEPLFDGHSEVQQLSMMQGTLGELTTERWPEMDSLPYAQHLSAFTGRGQSLEQVLQAHLSSVGIDLVSKLLEPDPQARLTASDALNHEYFTDNAKFVDDIRIVD